VIRSFTGRAAASEEDGQRGIRASAAADCELAGVGTRFRRIRIDGRHGYGGRRWIRRRGRAGPEGDKGRAVQTGGQGAARAVGAELIDVSAESVRHVENARILKGQAR